tara:strand:+ start:5517 stop:6866 length:1350 start_codon:yes stop_codon:yes gene_type:complete
LNNEESISKFNFLDAIGRPKTYKLLFPDEIEGMVIISLYERIKTGRYPNGFFSEDDIHDLFAKLQKGGNSGDKYYQRSINKNKIKKLLRFFLNYDEEKRLYYFQEYARAFCELSEKTLKGTLVPTQIEVICRDLMDDLNDALGNDKALLDWFNVKLEAYKTKLAQQTDFLHQQIDEAVSQLRKDVLDQEKEPLELLKKVRDDLTNIQQKNQELRIAFEDTNKIDSMLINIETENDQIIRNIGDTNGFFSRIQGKLRSTDRRLNRIQPKIKQLFAILRQSEWAANTEKFIHFLLKYSEVKGGGNDKELLFPIELKSVSIHSTKPKLIVFKRDETLFPPPARPRKKYPVDKTFQEESREQIQQEIDNFKRVEGWINQLMAQLQKDGRLDASQSFFEVMASDHDFATASRVLFGLVERVHHEKKYHVDISPREIIHQSQQPSALWKIMIQKA